MVSSLGTIAILGLSISACSKISDLVSGGGGGDDTQVAATQVRLSAFSNFTCTSNWTNRDGALGLKAGSGNGTCSAGFPGASGTYRVELVAQTEFDGSSHYRISINGNTAGNGRYPYSQGQRICNCPDWPTHCPDVNTNLNAGIHKINTGDKIEFWGAESYECLPEYHNGAYAKWHELVFTPLNESAVRDNAKKEERCTRIPVALPDQFT
jgi:hypothetical protein